MSLSKRLSISSQRSGRSGRSQSPRPRFVFAPNPESEEWVRVWESTHARDLIDCRIEEVDADTSVEDACDLLLSRDIPCLAVKAKPSADSSSSSSSCPYSGLFDFADVNAFLTFAATRHIYSPEHLAENPRVAQIVDAAKAGHVPVHLVSNLSEKNPLTELPHDASAVALLAIFSSGKHRVLIRSPTPTEGCPYLGMVSDRRLLSYFSTFMRQTTGSPSPIPSSSPSSPSPISPLSPSPSSFLRFMNNPLNSLPLPSLNLFSDTVALKSSDTVLDAMRRMSEQGVSSVAVIEEETGKLLSAVSVTDIGKLVVPSQSNQILTMPLHLFVTQIKLPDGSTDGADKYPVYSVFPSSTLSFTMQKLLATNAHRVFVTTDSPGPGSPSPPSNLATKSNLSGLVSIVDILSLFARVANLPNVDPTRMQRHRRASSASSHSSTSGAYGDLARSTSRGSLSSMTGPRV
ncbi:hypothetical protein DENSPDRAFT_841649 [Dentipellis sp. KUC8613]|nr:hypothetical protein DENSPDRAFT_841649 [Dentipellis sp. KUC8613]